MEERLNKALEELEKWYNIFEKKRKWFFRTREWVIALCNKYFTPVINGYYNEIIATKWCVTSEVSLYHLNRYSQFFKEWSDWKKTFSGWCSW